jgi:tRNA modification GTPase
MRLHPDDTIAARASAEGAGARAIVRVSGRDILPVLRAVLPDTGWSARRVPWRTELELQLPGWPCGFSTALHFWPGAKSYTGQPLAELHLPGSPPLVEAVLAHLCRNGARLAEPGEFTLRAFLAGRLDLTQAEAVLGVIDARSLGELQSALNQLAGGLSTQIGRLRGELLDLLADLEAGLDFAHEAIEFVPHPVLVQRLEDAQADLARLEAQAAGRTRPARQPRVVLAGPPNAGKSTLFNALTGRDLALVSPERGTTRDFLTAEVTWDGLALTLIDTAGEDEATETIARDAQTHRTEQLAAADLVLSCRPVTEDAEPASETVLAVLTKGDLCRFQVKSAVILTSATTGLGLSELKAAVIQSLSAGARPSDEWLGSTALRSREALTRAGESLAQAVDVARSEGDQALLAIELHDALDQLGTIVGAVYTDDMLDRIFSRFCIGK